MNLLIEIIIMMFKYIAFFYFLIFLVSIPFKDSNAIKLDILCYMKSSSSSNEFRDLIVSIDSESKTIALGGFKFTADEFIVSDSNIKWSAKSVKNMYDAASGFTSGTLGRFSGNMSLTFKKNDLGTTSTNEINFQCQKFKMKNRKF